jgi:hypothetical protein
LSYTVEVVAGARRDLHELAGEDVEVVKEAIRLLARLEHDPYLGGEMRERHRFRLLADCRRIRFDRPDRAGKPRYRLVYRNEPSDGAPGVVVVLAVATRAGLHAYARAQTSLADRLRGQRGS